MSGWMASQGVWPYPHGDEGVLVGEGTVINGVDRGRAGRSLSVALEGKVLGMLAGTLL